MATRFIVMVAAGLLMGWGVPDARANVFASNVQLNQTSTNLITDPGDSVTIHYLLNQNADAGVTVALFNGPVTVWSTNRTGGGAGTLRGTNLIVWNGLGTNGQVVSNGTWTVRVTAGTVGSTNWTKVPMRNNTPEDRNGDGYVWSPKGIAVNNNTNSSYFGRVFVGNAGESGLEAEPGDLVGIGKYNADGGYAAEGSFSTGGWPWAGNDSSPWKVEVGADDRVYVVDGASQCTVVSFDQIISSNSPQLISLRTDNMANAAVNYSGIAVTGVGTNRQIYGADIGNTGPGGVGIRRWSLGAAGAAATNDPGITVVSTAPNLSLDLYPQDVAVDSSNRIYTIQDLQPGGPSTNRVLGYPAFQSNALTAATWTVTNETLVSAFGIAAALHTNYLGVVCRVDVGNPINVFNRDTGAAIAVTGLNSGFHDYTDIAWDRAGNLYVSDYLEGRWRVFSPPGGNQFTTLALQTIRVGAPLPPTLSQPQWQSGQFTVNVNGEPGLRYAVDSSTNLVTWSPTTTNLALSAVTPFAIPAPLNKTFFRARIVP